MPNKKLDASTGRFTKTHGMSYHRLYGHWHNMMNRCYNPKKGHWDRYGGRGIGVSERWNNVVNFIEDMDSSYSPGLELERMDNNKGYSKDNCKWETHKKQSRNRMDSRIIIFGGESLNLVDWARRIGISHKTLSWRLAKWPLEKAVTAPPYYANP